MPSDDDPYLEIRQSWLVTTLTGEPFVTEGTLTVSKCDDGSWLLEVSSGDENHPAQGRGGDGWESVQMPLKEEYAALLIRALEGERVGEITDRGR